MPFSQNGWSTLASSLSSDLKALSWITGRVRAGAVHTLFDLFCERFNKEVEQITHAHSWGYAARAIRGSTVTSNHASGTAIDLNAPKHPLGMSGTFTAPQRTALRRILADFDGVIRWGGDYAGRKDEMHFEINAPAGKVSAAVAKLSTAKPVTLNVAEWQRQLGGVDVDGVRGPETYKRIKKRLNGKSGKGGYTLRALFVVTGTETSRMWKGVQKLLNVWNKRGVLPLERPLAITGKPDRRTSIALNRSLKLKLWEQK